MNKVLLCSLFFSIFYIPSHNKQAGIDAANNHKTNL